MPDPQLQQDLEALIALMSSETDVVKDRAAIAQDELFYLLRNEIANFELKNGALVKGQSLQRRIAAIQAKMEEVLGRSYSRTVSDYFGSFTTVEERTVAMHRTYNDVTVAASKITPARQFVLQQATYFLEGAGLAENFIQPAKFLLMQSVVSGLTLEDAQELLKKWSEGELFNGNKTQGRVTPSLEQYATQVTRDVLFQYHGTLNDIVATEYGLEAFVYVGGIVKDSRPLCRHLVGLDREILFSELPKLIAKYPGGIIPGTNSKNFVVYRGGYGCLHECFPVKKTVAE